MFPTFMDAVKPLCKRPHRVTHSESKVSYNWELDGIGTQRPILILSGLQGPT